MARLSSIETLPPEVRADLDKRLAEGRFTLDTLIDYLEEQGHNISRSALGRYRQKFEEVAAKMRESREVAAAFARELGSVPGDDMGQMLIELVHTLVFKTSMNMANGDDEKLEAKEVMQLARSLKDLSSSKQMDARRIMEIRAEEKKRVEAEMKDKLTAAAREGGMSAEAAREARRALGFGDE
ncbi:hypothetical protein C4J81_15420 [Deltaproteobacteria bacterium Smac51]|nr:hypothetical protein C4J81_03445 [Deltaproteobacteria bacterium Smac51]UQZ89545.1 hypothetical protein C4J81_10155 [Deltaproteobacteria bacterium Smac51]UQZ90520.1 hypothetical protein C4J81_15420 [Deltaproteobacteria bacterium Smac51]